MKGIPFLAALVLTAGIGAALWLVRSAETGALRSRVTELKGESVSPAAKAGTAATGASKATVVKRKPSAFGSLFGAVDEIWAIPDDQVADLAKEMFKKRPGENAVAVMKLMAIYSRWAEIDPKGALQHILDSTNGGRLRDERGVALMGLYSTWIAKDAGGAFTSIAGMKEGQMKKGMMEFLPRYLTFMRPDLTEGWDNAMASGGVEQKEMEDLAAIKASRDPEAAIKELDGVTDPADRKKRVEAILMGLSVSNPERAIEVAPQILGDADLRRQQSGMMTMAMSSLAAKNPDKAMEQYLKAPAELKEAYAGSFRSYGSLEPDKIKEMQSKLTSPEEKKKFMNEAIAGKAAEAPGAAAEMLADMPAADRTPEAHQQIAQGFARKDFAGAQEWIGTLPPGAGRDQAVVGTVQNVEANNRPRAAEMIAEISDQKSRQDTATNFARGWLEQDKAAATNWITSTPDIPADQKQAIIKGEADTIRLED